MISFISLCTCGGTLKVVSIANTRKSSAATRVCLHDARRLHEDSPVREQGVLVGAADGPVVHDIYLIGAPVAHSEREYDGEPLDEEVEVLCFLARRAHLAGAAGAAHLADAAADAAGGGHGQRAHHATHIEEEEGGKLCLEG